ncbi:STAS domain-containing protein [Solimonas soli]|uniref:STAS domain-containing protein n=1 Tax=Solimonas soli TaxID=413479 RepID=UPI00068716B3|nr:STAS domain-containing protein [Solimonas soli]
MSSSAPHRTDAPAAPVLRLPADLGIEHVGALRDALAAQLEAEALTLDAGDSTRLHAGALQLLAAFCRERRDAGRVTGWGGASAAFADAVRIAGLESLLNFKGAPA